MRVLEKIPLRRNSENNTPILPSPAERAAKKAAWEARLKGNNVSVQFEDDHEITRVDISYAIVLFQSASLLEESDHIILGCPVCDEVLYEVRWK